MKGYAMPSFTYADRPARRKQDRYYRAEVQLLEGGQDYDVMGYSKEQIITDVLSQYERHRHFLHLTR
jgi:choline/glycine/proline betaine transport protein